jgi:hypothetical protein
MWATREVAARHPMVKRVDHPIAGPLEFECQVMHIQDTGDGTEVRRLLPQRLLRTIGAWRFLDHYRPDDTRRSPCQHRARIGSS